MMTSLKNIVKIVKKIGQTTINSVSGRGGGSL